MRGSFILTSHDMALPVAGEIRGAVLVHRESGDAMRLVTVAHAPVILTP